MRARAGIDAFLLIAAVGMAGIIIFEQDDVQNQDIIITTSIALRGPGTVGSSTAVPNHAPIAITGNSQLDAFPGKTGTGTAMDPYVIRDLVIDRGGTGACLSFWNTDKPLTIMNCTFLHGSYGVYIRDSDSVTVTDCMFDNVGSGVYVWYECKDVHVRRCVIRNCTDAGITFRGCTYAAGCDAAFNNVSCAPQAQSAMGIFVWFTNGLSIVSNSFTSSKYYGLYIWFAENTTITRNVVSNNARGLLFRDSPTGVVYNNSFVNNTQNQAIVLFGIGTRAWDYGGVGNYWSDYASKYPSATNDNVTWNTPYVITSPYQDGHPLVRPHDVPLPPNDHDYMPVASFTLGVTTAIANSGTQFMFTGAPGNIPASFQWDFGDGSANSTLENPSHAYATTGTYSVAVTITDADGDTSTFTRANCITILPDYRPVANFSASATTVSSGSPVTFTYTGTEGNSPLSFRWYFSGSNSGYVYTRNPTVTYPTPGTYYVSLQVTDADGDTNQMFKHSYINVSSTVPVDLQPVASFSANTTSTIAGQNVAFTYTGTIGDGITSYKWCFGDGSVNDTRQNPVHRFNTPGTYPVRLTVTDQDGDASTATSATPITVVADLTPVARFTRNSTLIVANQSVQFHFNGTEGNAPATMRWSFGDGTASSGSRNPCHRYATWGVFNVTLEVVDRDGDKSTLVKNACVVVLPRIAPLVLFSVKVSALGTNLSAQFAFTGDQGYGIASYEWTFGDGENSSEGKPVHVYSRPGVYSVTLSVTDIFGYTYSVSRLVSIDDTPTQPGELITGRQQEWWEVAFPAIIMLGLVVSIVAGRMVVARKKVHGKVSAGSRQANKQVTGVLSGPGREILDAMQEMDARALSQPSSFTASVVGTMGNARKLVVRHLLTKPSIELGSESSLLPSTILSSIQSRYKQASIEW